MRWDRLLFGAFLAVALVVALLILAVPEPPDARGRPHPEIAEMSHGGAPERHRPLLGWGFAFGALSFLTFGACLALGAGRRDGDLRGLGRHLVWGTAGLVAIWTALVLSYRGTLGPGPERLFLFLPAPSAIMVYLLYPASLIYNLLFVIGFKRWVLTDEDHRAYRRMLERRPLPGGERDGREPGGSG